MNDAIKAWKKRRQYRIKKKSWNADAKNDKDKKSTPKKSNNGSHGNTALPYGIAEGKGIDTEGMEPKEVWEALEGKGVSPKKEYKKLEARNENKPNHGRKPKDEQSSADYGWETYTGESNYRPTNNPGWSNRHSTSVKIPGKKPAVQTPQKTAPTQTPTKRQPIKTIDIEKSSKKETTTGTNTLPKQGTEGWEKYAEAKKNGNKNKAYKISKSTKKAPFAIPDGGTDAGKLYDTLKHKEPQDEEPIKLRIPGQPRNNKRWRVGDTIYWQTEDDDGNIITGQTRDPLFRGNQRNHDDRMTQLGTSLSSAKEERDLYDSFNNMKRGESIDIDLGNGYTDTYKKVGADRWRDSSGYEYNDDEVAWNVVGANKSKRSVSVRGKGQAAKA